MTPHHRLLTWLAFVLAIGLAGCSPSPASTPSASAPTGPEAYEARVRYILADSQIGEVIDYYRERADDPAVAEAVRRWDVGIRVVNPDDFERRNVDPQGWQVVYAGTDTLIDGADVILCSDAGYDCAPTQDPVTDCPGASATGLAPGMTAIEVNPKPYEDMVFSTLGPDSKQVATLAVGDRVQVLDGPLCHNTLVWWWIRTADGIEGWATEGELGALMPAPPDETIATCDSGVILGVIHMSPRGMVPGESWEGVQWTWQVYAREVSSGRAYHTEAVFEPDTQQPAVYAMRLPAPGSYVVYAWEGEIAIADLGYVYPNPEAVSYHACGDGCRPLPVEVTASQVVPDIDLEWVVHPAAVIPGPILDAQEASGPRANMIFGNETLSDVAARLGVSVEALIQATPGLAEGRTEPGRAILVPGTDSGGECSASSSAPVPAGGTFITYTVSAGDFLSGIAQAHNVSVEALLAANPGLDPNGLVVGQELQILIAAALETFIPPG